MYYKIRITKTSKPAGRTKEDYNCFDCIEENVNTVKEKLVILKGV